MSLLIAGVMREAIVPDMQAGSIAILECDFGMRF